MSPSMPGGAARERTGSFSSASSAGDQVAPGEEQKLEDLHQLPPFMGSPPEMFDDDDVVGGDLQLILAGAPSQPPPAAPPPAKRKKKRSLPGTPDPSAEVVALSPRTLMATNRFVCEICHKGFQRDQNLQLHRRGHNLPWKLRQRGSGGEGGGGVPRKRVYVCPEASCVHHNPSRALGDLTGIKKHFCRKHGEKKWRCDRCAKRYAVHSDWKAHSKVCGTREYKCDCGTVFSRRDSFVTHRAFCDALTQENNKLAHPMTMATVASALQGQGHHQHLMPPPLTDDVDMDADADADADAAAVAAGFLPDVKSPHLTMFSAAGSRPLLPGSMVSCMLSSLGGPRRTTLGSLGLDGPSSSSSSGSISAMTFSPAAAPASMSATALLQKAAQMGATTTSGYGAGFPSMGLGATMCGLDRLPTSQLGPLTAHGPYNGFLAGFGQLVGFDSGGLLRGPQHDGGAHGTVRSPIHGERHTTQANDLRVVDFMGVEAQRAFNDLASFDHHLGPWP